MVQPSPACKDLAVPGTRTIQEGPDMAGSMTEIPVNGDAVPAYISLPPAGSGPGVVVIQEWWGLVPHVRNVADRLAAQGFVAVAPDLYRGKQTAEPDEAGKLVMEMQLEQAAKDMAAAVDALLAMPETTGEGVGVVGFCVGGGLALFLATLKPEVAATVCYYGFPRDGMNWDLSAVKGAVLGHAAGHQPRLLQRQPARGPRPRGGRPVLAADARVPAPASRSDFLSGRTILGYADRRRGVVQRGQVPRRARRQDGGCQRPPGASPVSRADETFEPSGVPQGPDRAGGTLGR